MSGGVRTFKLAGGGYADVPEENLDAWMKRMDQRGIQFETADVKPEMTVGEPQVIKTPREGSASASGSWGPDEEMGFMQRFSGALKDNPPPTSMNPDALRGFNSGLYLGGSDEMEALSPGRTLEQARAANAEAEKRSPWLYNGAKVAGYVPGMLLAPESAMARVGAAGIEGMIGGGLSSDSNNASKTADDAMAGGLWGAGLSGATELGAQAWGGLKNLGGKAVDYADELRNAAFGGTAADFQKLARTQGLDYVEGGPGEAARRMGLTNTIVPQSPSTYARKSAAMMNDVGAQKAAALAEADQSLGTHVVTDDLAQGIEGRGSGAAMDATPEGQAEQARLAQMAQLVRAQNPPVLAPTELDAQKQAYYRRGYQQDKIPDSSAALGAESNRMAGAEARDQLNAALLNAPPGVNGRVQNANQDYGELATINTMAQNRAAALQAPQGGGFFSTMAAPATKALKSYGPDLAANAGTLAGQGMQGMGAPMQSGALAAARTPFGPAAGAMQGPAMPPPSAPMGPSSDPSSDGIPSNARGYLKPDVARQMLQQNPMAFGKYTQQFQQAMQNPDPSELVKLLDRLETTDPQFDQQYGTMLLQATAGMGGR